MTIDKKQIYIVDDDESVCRALKCLLMTFGFAVNTFPSSEKFFSAVPNSAQGCLILDIHMPGLDGWEAIKRMIKSGSKRPVIIITADKNGGLEGQALKAGAVGFFQKPINDQELVDLINKALNQGKEMKKKITVILCSLLLAMPVLSFAEEKNGHDPSVSAYEHANENAKFKRSRDLFNSKANRKIRAKRLAEKKAKEAAEAKKKAQEAQDKGEGQVKVKF